MGLIKGMMDEIVNDEKLLRSLARMSERWADEREYEDFNQYADVMRGLTVHEFIRATKRPFGFVVKVGQVKVAVYLKNYSAYSVLAAKTVKK